MSDGALTGVRVLSFGQALAGGECAALLADLGAEVARVESIRRAMGPRIRLWRDHPPVFEPSGVETDTTYGTTNRGQLGLSLDMSSDAGRSVALRLAGAADILVENFSVGVLDRWGLGAETLRATCPRLVVVSLPAFGSSGPYRDWVGFGGNMSSYVGLASIWGLSEGRHNDYIGGVHGALAAVAGLAQRDQTGAGVHIEVPQVEAGAALLGAYMLNRVGDGSGTPPPRYPTGALQAVVRCAGEDRWLAIDLRGDDDVQRLAAVVAGDDAANLEELTARTEAWAADRTAHQAMHALQAQGICAGVVQNGADLFYDPQLWARDAIVEIDHPDLGPAIYPESPLRMSETPGRYRSRMPRTGEHTREIVERWLEIDAPAFDALDETGAFA